MSRRDETISRSSRRKAELPGMVPSEQWAKTAVHKASTYFCGRCGEGFASPDEVYAHLDSVHPTKRGAAQ